MSTDLTPKNAATGGSTMSGALGGTTNPEEDEKNKLIEQTSTTSSVPTTIGAGGATSPSVKAMPKQQKAGTGTFANLKSYLQAAQGGGRVSQAATQRVQNVASQAQQGVKKAQETFGTQMKAGSGALFANNQKEEDVKSKAQADAARILGTAIGTTYQVPQTAPVAAEGQAPAQPVQPPQQYFSSKDMEDYSNILNAQYQGPQSLQQAGLYEQAARRAQVAQQALQQTQSAAGREQLLRDVYGKNREYTRGQSKLDALLLNASRPAVQNLQQQAQQIGNIQQQLQEAQNLSANEAAQRAAVIQGIASGARQNFVDARTAEEDAVEKRLSKTVENWNKLPEYFKELIKNKEKGSLNLSQQESDILGLKSGEGFYNLGAEDLIKTNAAEKNRLITKNELSKQLALQQLANLDKSKQLQKDLLYSDLSKAGTQTAADAINKEALRNTIAEEEKRFEEFAKKTNLSGQGSKKDKSSGDVYKSIASANLGDVLKDLGYTNTTSTLPLDQYIPKNIERSSDISDFYGEPMKNSYATATADKLAAEDLQRRINESLNTAGFSNRAVVGDTEATEARAAALKAILGIS